MPCASPPLVSTPMRLVCSSDIVSPYPNLMQTNRISLSNHFRNGRAKDQHHTVSIADKTTSQEFLFTMSHQDLGPLHRLHQTWNHSPKQRQLATDPFIR